MVSLLSSYLKPRDLAPKLAVFVAVLAFAGCAVFAPIPGDNSVKQQELLQPWLDLTGAQSGAAMGLYIVLRQPAAISARNNDAYLLDTGLRRIFRYSRFEQTLTPFSNLPAEDGMNIYVASDMSVYITDLARVQVLHFASNGIQLPTLGSAGDLGRPVSIAADKGSGQILVADALYDQIVTFNNLGRTLSIIKPQQVRGIAAIVIRADEIFVLDRIARQVVVIARDGSYHRAFAVGTLVDPKFIAVDRTNLVFISDNFDQTIKVYRNEKLVGTIGGKGAAPGRFNNIAGMAVDGDLLYVTDSLNARVQIMHINSYVPDNRKGD